MMNETKANGYKVETVVAHIIDMDVDAAGNAEKAAWKRYLVLILMAQAKAVDKKKLIEAVFGKGGKASKTFQNMWGVANASRNVVLGNRSWDDIRTMPMAEAKDTVLLSINAHMSSLDVSSKNEYEKVCMFSPSEAAAKREADAQAKAEAKAEADAKAEAEKATQAEAEADAQAEADAKPERTPLEAVKAVMQGASMDDAMAVMSWMADVMPVDALRVFLEERLARLDNEAAAAARDVTPGTDLALAS